MNKWIMNEAIYVSTESQWVTLTPKWKLHYEVGRHLEPLTISSYGVDVMGTFLRAMLLIVANLSL